MSADNVVELPNREESRRTQHVRALRELADALEKDKTGTRMAIAVFLQPPKEKVQVVALGFYDGDDTCRRLMTVFERTLGFEP